ncbi:MAG: large subunit ribosomal protein L21 [Chloroflexi bacterium]|nr:MAG: large subunit ribosomal protein L21 [Chloroflexota bacterium]
MYAVIRTGGKQYRVEAGQQLRVEKLPGAAGDRVEFPEVLMIGGNGDVAVGAPMVANAKVVGEIIEQGRSRKVTAFKYKNKTRYKRKLGHRQQQTVLAITEIQGPDGTAATYELRHPVAVVEPADADVSDVDVSAETPAPTDETPTDESAAEAASDDGAAEKAATKRAPATKKAAAKKAPAAKNAPAAKKAAAKKAPAAKKAAAKKAPAAKKAAAKKAPAAKKAAKKTGADKDGAD